MYLPVRYTTNEALLQHVLGHALAISILAGWPPLAHITCKVSGIHPSHHPGYGKRTQC